MTQTRRSFLALGALGTAGLALSGCMESAPPVLAVSAQADAGANDARPTTLQIVQMTGTGAFNSTDVIGLSQDPAGALGAEFVKSDRLVVAPGGAASTQVVVDARTTAIGVVGGFIDPAGKQVRATTPAPAKDSGLVISVGSGGISLAPA